MKRVRNIIARFSAQLMLIAMLAMTFQVSVASAAGPEGQGDCFHHVHEYQAAHHNGPLFAAEHGRTGPDHGKAPCKSACCSSACAMVLLEAPSMVEGPAEMTEIPGLPVSSKVKGIDLEGPSRPPKPLSAV